MNALAALLAARELGGDVARGADALANFTALKGRGARFLAGGRRGDRRKLQRQSGVDGGRARAAREAAPQGGGRRIAVLGDMLEMGDDSPRPAQALARNLAAARADLVFLCGPQMKALWDALPAKTPRRLCGNVRRACARVMRALQGGRYRAGQGIVRQPHGGDHRCAERARSRRGLGGDACSIISWCRLPDSVPVFNVFRYLTFRTGGAVHDGADHRFVIGPGARSAG